MAGPGDVSGRAVRLNFPRIQQQQPQTVGTGGAGARSSAGRRSSGQTSFNDAISAPEGIQLDQAGIYQETYKAYGALRSYLATARAKGIDPLQGPDPNVPESFAVVNEWNRAVATYEMMLERGKQGLDNLNYVRDAVGNGEMFAGDGILSGDTGVLSQEETIQNTTVADPNWLNRDVNLLKSVPDTEAQYNEMVGYRERRVADMQRQVEDGSMTDEQFQYYLSKLPVPAKYSAPPVKSSSGGGGGGSGDGKQHFEPRTEELVTLMNTVKSGGNVSPDMIKSLGSGYQGDPNVPLVGTRAVDGDLELTFQKRIPQADLKRINDRIDAIKVDLETRAREDVNPNLYAQKTAELADLEAQLQGETFTEYVSEENVLGALRFFMKYNDFQGLMDDLRKQGMKAGEEDLEGLNRFFGFGGKKDSGGSSGQSRTMPGFEDEKKDDPAPETTQSAPLDP